MTRYHYARMLLKQGTSESEWLAQELLDEAEQHADEIGLRWRLSLIQAQRHRRQEGGSRRMTIGS